MLRILSIKKVERKVEKKGRKTPSKTTFLKKEQSKEERKTKQILIIKNERKNKTNYTPRRNRGKDGHSDG